MPVAPGRSSGNAQPHAALRRTARGRPSGDARRSAGPDLTPLLTGRPIHSALVRRPRALAIGGSRSILLPGRCSRSLLRRPDGSPSDGRGDRSILLPHRPFVRCLCFAYPRVIARLSGESRVRSCFPTGPLDWLFYVAHLPGGHCLGLVFDPASPLALPFGLVRRAPSGLPASAASRRHLRTASLSAAPALRAATVAHRCSTCVSALWSVFPASSCSRSGCVAFA